MYDYSEPTFDLNSYRGDHYPRQRTPWGIKEIILVILLVVVIEFAYGMVSHLLGLQQLTLFPGFTPQMFSFIMSGLVQTAAFMLLIFGVVTYYHRSLSAVGLRRCSWSNFLITGVLGGLGVLLLVTAVMLLITSLMHYAPSPQPFTEMVKQIHHRGEMIALVVLGGVIAPFGEELYFRGFVYPALRCYGKTPALLISACFFGAMHFDLARFIPLSLGGLCLALICEKTDSIIPSWAAHSTWNITMTLLLLLGGQAM